MIVQGNSVDVPDDVDDFLANQDGMIERGRDSRMCRHNARQKCTHCLPLDPYDEEYLKEKEIKHMSFHSYVRKLTAGHGKGRAIKPLENLVCKLKPDCPGHKPYPQGICSKCAPPMVTLNRQKFRHVDNISIENEDVVNRFLGFWRRSGNQRIGYLIGKYEPFLEVPLGIKATVVAIYEPPQESCSDEVSLIHDSQEKKVDLLCSYLNLRRVGWIFTDLWSADSSIGTVHCTRYMDSFLLSAQECITAGFLQNKYRNLTSYCTDGYFGSKFVTLVASGDQSEHIHFSGYQVSNQCAALVDANVLCPTSCPELAYIREKPLNPKHYIPDVHYTEKNEYGVETRRDGRPMPVEFMLVDVPAGMPKEPNFTFHAVSSKELSFPIENRQCIGEKQDAVSLGKYVSQFSRNQFLELASNFHFLLFLMTNDIVHFSEDEIKALCVAVKEHDRVKAVDWADSTTNWSTLTALIQHTTEQNDAGSLSEHWACKHCTYVNTERRPDCAICGLPYE
uniref:Nuclear protein localization protein 4-like protein n=1 Tax=Syphacia muris TaxID=451379 RepID=A0A0N5AGC4_9BILA